MSARTISDEVMIDRSSAVPLYQQLATQLTDAISDGRLQPGDAIENEIDLAERLTLSRPTVRQAIAELVQQGLLIRRRGIGTTVANRVIHRRAELTSLHEDLVRENRAPTTSVLTHRTVTDQDAAAALGLPPDTPLLHLVRLRFAEASPLAVLQNWLPAALVADPTPSSRDLESVGLYTLLRERGIRPTVARQSIGARVPTVRERRLLELRGNAPVLTMTRSAYAADGTPVEFGSHSYRADQYTIDVLVHER
ncbi:GntR family transcriptional regulator [Nakamurella sp. A5-74]|uniref:GntR family transcriptional regulator n=1 Tax=Nakamurella sp. A5-74 TaxID=3158264 RepID=A0AAU8DUB7_9ACTN